MKVKTFSVLRAVKWPLCTSIHCLCHWLYWTKIAVPMALIPCQTRYFLERGWFSFCLQNILQMGTCEECLVKLFQTWRQSSTCILSTCKPRELSLSIKLLSENSCCRACSRSVFHFTLGWGVDDVYGSSLRPLLLGTCSSVEITHRHYIAFI